MNSRLPWTDTSPWPPGHTTDASSCGLPGALDVVGVEAVVVADDDVVAAEGEVGVGEAQPVRSRPDRTVAACAGSRGRRVRDPPAVPAAPALPAGAFGSKKPSGFGQPRDQLHVARRFAGVAEVPASGRRADRFRGGRLLGASRQHRRDENHGDAQDADRHADLIAEAPSCGRASRPCDRSPCADRRRRRTRTRRSRTPGRRPARRTDRRPSSARRRGA